MIGKKFIALLVVGGLTASIGITAGAYTENVSSKAKVSYAQVQGQTKAVMVQQDMKTKLDALVKAGTITQAVEDKVITYLNKLEADRKIELAKVQSMTEAERKAYYDSKVKVAKIDLFADLVKSGTLTQIEADALKAALPQGLRGEGRGNRAGFNKVNLADIQANMKTKLDAAVKAGTITQTQADAIKKVFPGNSVGHSMGHSAGHSAGHGMGNLKH